VTVHTKCPVCGVEEGPCAVQNGHSVNHIERIRAANPTRYEHPECEECRKHKDDMVRAQDDVLGFRPQGKYRPRSRWPKDYDREMSRMENYRNLARAKYELHLFGEHKDKEYEGRVFTNMEILIREGRLKP
jgi:hypothetical protein